MTLHADPKVNIPHVMTTKKEYDNNTFKKQEY